MGLVEDEGETRRMICRELSDDGGVDRHARLQHVVGSCRQPWFEKLLLDGVKINSWMVKRKHDTEARSMEGSRAGPVAVSPIASDVG